MTYERTRSIRDWLAYFTEETGETITHLCVGFAWPDGCWPDWPVKWPHFDTNRVMSVAEFGDVLDVRFNPESQSWIKVCGWSPSWVLLTAVYDGSIWPTWVPRNPIDHSPIQAGGG